MRLRAIGIIGIAAATAVLAACFSERTTATGPTGGQCSIPLTGVPGSTVVIIKNFVFQPAQVTVRPGATVSWVNCETDGTTHTSTADQAAWDSPLLDVGVAFTFTAPAAGTYTYHCAPHPTMLGSLIVQ
ncbi:MAG: plastocyanin/azurin family copper-binding protein [Gemmatimonadota bacterium]